MTPEATTRAGSAAKRSEIERAALSAFLHDGFSRTSVDAVAAAAGVSKRTVYDYYGSKERLFLDVLEQTFATHEARFAELLERTLGPRIGGPEDLERALTVFGHEFASGTGQAPDRGAILGLLTAEAPHFPSLLARLRSAGPQQHALAGRLRELADAGLLDVDDPVEAAMHLGNLVTAPVHQRTLNGAIPIPDDELARIVGGGVRVFLRAYGPRERKFREPTVHMPYAERMNHELTDWIDRRAPGLTVTDPGPKLDDRPGEQAGRHRALVAVRAALDVEGEVGARATEATADRARTAAWLGASLADLAAVTGHSRQAARKRWPALGPVARRRRWLGYHVDEILWAADLVLRHAAAFPASSVDGLADDVAALHAAFGPAGQGAATPPDDPVARWRMLDDVVDRRLRAVADAPPTGTDEAEFARTGAAGLVAYYDHATRRDTGDDPS